MACGIIMAAPITENEARAIALIFFSEHKGDNTAMSLDIDAADNVVTALQTDEYYVFNGNGGFVIVSGDDATVPVLGWSDEGTFDANSINPSVKAWLDGYQQEIQSLSSDNVATNTTLTNWATVNPLVTTKWNQDAPYNNMVPIDPKTNKRSYTGCPSISLAQLLNYYKYPKGEMLRSIPAQRVYQHSDTQGGRNFKNALDALEKTTFNWSIMKESYSDPDETGAAVDEIAKLIKYSGYALGMAYSSEGSASPSLSAINAMQMYFGYQNVQLIYRNMYSHNEWEKLVYGELQNGKPVIYDGSSFVDGKISGHSFIVDGYEGGYYHINWGWGGEDNGHFLLSVLNSDYKKADGEKKSGGYSYFQSIILLDDPNKTEAPTESSDSHVVGVGHVGVYDGNIANVDYAKIDLNETVLFTHILELTRDGAPYDDAYEAGRNYKLGVNYYNMTTRKNVFTEPLEMVLNNSVVNKIPAGSYNTLTFTSRVPDALTDGNYAMQWYYSDQDADDKNWYLMACSNEIFLNMTIKDGYLNISPSGDYLARQEDMEVNSKEVDGIAEVYKPVTVKYNLGNNSMSNNRGVFLWYSIDDKDYYPSNGAGTDLDRGAKGDVYLQFTPYSVGTYHVVLNNNCEGAYDRNSDIVNSYMKVNVTGTSLNAEVTNIDKDFTNPNNSQRTLTTNAVEGNTLMVTTDELPCQKTLYVVLRYNDEEDASTYTYSADPTAATNYKVTNDFSADSYGMATGTFKFENLKSNTPYMIAIGTVEGGKIKILYGDSTTFYTPDASAVESISEEETIKSAAYYDLTGRQLNGKPARKGMYIKNGRVMVVE